MNKTILIFTVITFFVCYNLTAQTILKKKEVSDKLVQIKTEIDENNYEAAFNIFFDKENVILAENVKKKEIEKYNGIKATLENKKNEFEKTNDEVESLITAYNSKNFDNAIKLLSIKLSKENSYKKTQKKLEEILPKIKTTKSSCEENKVNIAKWKQGFENQEYENIYKILDFSNTFSNCFYNSDLSELQELQNELKPLHKIYISTKENTVDKPQKVLKSINYSYLDYEKSIQLIEQLNGFTEIINSEPDKLKGKNPLLVNDIQNTKQEIEKDLIKLKEFSEAKKPLSQAEVETLFKSSSMSIPFEKLLKYSEPAYDEMYLIYDLNVFDYYSLNDKYDSDLKKSVYEKTSEYHEQFEELKQKKENMLKTKFYLQQNDKFYGDYDINKKGFNINIIYDGYPESAPKSIRMKEKDMYFKSLTSKRKTFTIFGAGGIHEILFIPMNETNALEIENEKQNISIYYFFTPNGKEEVSYQFICLDGYSFCNTRKTLLKAATVRVVVVNKVTKKIYYDKLY